MPEIFLQDNKFEYEIFPDKDEHPLYIYDMDKTLFVLYLGSSFKQIQLANMEFIFVTLVVSSIGAFCIDLQFANMLLMSVT